MSTIAILAAGGTLGRLLVDEARTRGHAVLAVVREPPEHAGLERDGVDVVAADLTDPDAVVRAVRGADAAVSAAGATHRPADDPRYAHPADIARALLVALAAAGVPRLLVVGGAGGLQTAPGVLYLDDPAVPDAVRPIARAHLDALHALRDAAPSDVDWVYFAPPPTFVRDGPRTGTYRIGGDAVLRDADGASVLSYADAAVALLDEVERPRHHRARFTAAA